MSAATLTPTTAIEVLRHQAQVIHRIVRLSIEDLTQEESLIRPEPRGNCLNWVIGHLVCVNEDVLALVKQKPVMGKDALSRYKRGSGPLQDTAAALEIGKLLEAWDEQAARLDAGLAALPPESLEQPAPFSPRNDPGETVGSLLPILLFHQSYHAGQAGFLRRMAGKDGVMK